MSSYIDSSRILLSTLDKWTTWTQNDIDSDKRIIDTVNALVVVSAFIAGIQASMISVAITLPDSGVGRAAKILCFVGLMLDVIGTFLGVIHAIVIQQRIKETSILLNALTEIRTGVRAISKLQSDEKTNRNSNDDIGDAVNLEQLREAGISDPEGLIRHVQQSIPAMEDRFHRTAISNLGLEHAISILQGRLASVEMLTSGMVKHFFSFGYTPLIAMGLGVWCLVVSTTLFAAASTTLLREVWLSCVIVLSSVLGLSLLPMSYNAVKAGVSGGAETLPG